MSLYSLRSRLALLVLFAVLPAFGFILYMYLGARGESVRNAEETALRLARVAAVQHQRIIQTTRDILFALAHEVEGGSPGACASFFQTLRERYPFYANVGVAELNGDVSCSGLPLTEPVNIADRLYFQRAVATRQFSSGEYQIGRITGRASINFGYPVQNSTGGVSRVVFAAVDLVWLNDLARQAMLPPGSTVTVVDRQGIVLARFPEPEKWVGKAAPDAAIVRAVLERQEGVEASKGLDGKDRLYGFVPLGRPPETGVVYVSIGIPREAALAGLGRLATRSAEGLALITLLVIAATRVGGNLLILRPIAAVVAATERVRAGDLTVRTRMNLQRGELAQLTTAFDAMAEALEQRTTQLNATDLRLKEALDEAHRRLRQLQALRSIDLAIMGSMDLRVSMGVLVTQVVDVLRVDASAILLLQPRTNQLEYVTGVGFRTDALKYTRLKLGEGHAGQAALERRVVTVPNLRDAPGSLEKSPLIMAEGFVSYHAVPLVAKGTLNGVLEVFHRGPLEPDQEWVDFLEALAGQAAIAIDNTGLFDNLQRANTDLVVAYDATLEGWSKALDLRDKETEDHTLRVTEMTVEVARGMGVGEEELTHIRRGALLHDIGKMGIPDSILLKPGPLSDDEWQVMRQHPGFAYQLLSPIPYLRQALDIPYCHHEKWDGAGYPRGLKGDQIPLAARIFAVVDVWDALRSDRPYRKSWPEERVLAHIQEQVGKHFDPKVVEMFLAVVRTRALRKSTPA